MWIDLPLLLKLEIDKIVSKSLLDRVDFTHYMDPDLFDLGPLTQYFLRDDEEEELFAEAAVQLPKVVAETESDEIFSQAAALAEQRTGCSFPVASKIPESSQQWAIFCSKEHRNLRANPCQISIVEPKHGRAYLHYIEDESKNKPGGSESKQIKILQPKKTNNTGLKSNLRVIE